MCGIIGFNWEDKGLLEKGLREIEHRGPDEFGKFFDKDVSLGHRRLSILDLSSSGNQPMPNEDETLWIIFNGEIYNYKEIKKNLKKKHEFRSNTDTEILIHLYEEKGEDMLQELQGMFAFCIYDVKNKLFFIARDRIGIKPLYYYFNGKKFIFCSEIKGIIVDREIKRKVNPEALSYFLTLRANTGEETMLKRIKKLMPGHHLTYDIRKNSIYIKKYWDILFMEDKNKNYDYYLSELKSLLNDSVKARLMSDVPFGAYLSGGVDSATVVALMKKYSNLKIKTFSVGFENDNSELREAKFSSEKLNTEHRELSINEKAIKSLPEIIYQSDEPNSDPTCIPTYLLSKFAKRYCTVILTGEGADEIFAGYPQYKFMKIHDRILRKIPLGARKVIPEIINRTPKKILNLGFKFSSALGEKGIERFSNFNNTNNYSKQYLNQISIYNEKEKEKILVKEIKVENKFDKYFKNIDKIGIVNSCCMFDFKEQMVEDLLMKLDKNTMAFGVEGRVPFLDYRVVELAARIPQKWKLKGFTKDKFILRQLGKELLPDEIRKRKKRHFFVPIDSWLSNELAGLKENFLSKKFIEKQKIFNFKEIQNIMHGIKKSPLFYARQIWSLITFQIWYKQYIENEKVKI